MPAIVHTSPARNVFEPSGDDALENDIAMRAIRPDSALPIMTAVVVNDSETIA